jgi:hypothetical protein
VTDRARATERLLGDRSDARAILSHVREAGWDKRLERADLMHARARRAVAPRLQSIDGMSERTRRFSSTAEGAIRIERRSTAIRSAAALVVLGLALVAGGPVAAEGPIVAWGNNYSGQMTLPASWGGSATAIAAGVTHSCAIQAGTRAVVCWGHDYWGESTPPPSVNGSSGAATDIAAGAAHSCAIRAGSRAVVCWGSDLNGRATPPPSVNGVAGTASAISAGSGHTLAIYAPEPGSRLLGVSAGAALLARARRRRNARDSQS